MTDHDEYFLDDDDEFEDVSAELEQEMRQAGVLPKIDPKLGETLAGTLRRNIELREQLRREPLREDVIRNAVERSGAHGGARKLLELANAENDQLQAEVDAHPKHLDGSLAFPDKLGRQPGEKYYGSKLTNEQIDKMRGVIEVVPGNTGPLPTKKHSPRNLDEALDALAAKGLLAPTGSQQRNKEE